MVTTSWPAVAAIAGAAALTIASTQYNKRHSGPGNKAMHIDNGNVPQACPKEDLNTQKLMQVFVEGAGSTKVIRTSSHETVSELIIKIERKIGEEVQGIYKGSHNLNLCKTKTMSSLSIEHGSRIELQKRLKGGGKKQEEAKSEENTENDQSNQKKEEHEQEELVMENIEKLRKKIELLHAKKKKASTAEEEEEPCATH